MRHSDLSAPVLVFPHHGGNVGANSSVTENADFAERLMNDVRAVDVVFSIGRTRYENPRPEIVRAVRDTNANVRIACTQLSSGCRDLSAGSPAESAFGHLLDIHAQGRAVHACCAGSLRITADSALVPNTTDHEADKAAEAPTAQCR